MAADITAYVDSSIDETTVTIRLDMAHEISDADIGLARALVELAETYRHRPGPEPAARRSLFGDGTGRRVSFVPADPEHGGALGRPRR